MSGDVQDVAKSSMFGQKVKILKTVFMCVNVRFESSYGGAKYSPSCLYHGSVNGLVRGWQK